jgi:hypothetical protein
MARTRSIAFSAATIAACLLCAWPVTTAPPADADHFHMCCPMPSTTTYSIPRYCILREPAGAEFRSILNRVDVRRRLSGRWHAVRPDLPQARFGARRAEVHATRWRLRAGLRTELKLADGAPSGRGPMVHQFDSTSRNQPTPQIMIQLIGCRIETTRPHEGWKKRTAAPSSSA